ncbi:MAG TPA: hypothetical protein VEO53_07210 [Candidatus Binatia bacterium]|nr:hypothetical protein [Candidatus Binatia bacterium]
MRSEHYRQYACDCLRLGNSTLDPATKAVLVDMAQAWMKLAEQANSIHRSYGHLTLVSDRTKEMA